MEVSSKDELLKIIKNKTMDFKTKYQILKDIIILHPEILLKSNGIDTTYLEWKMKWLS